MPPDYDSQHVPRPRARMQVFSFLDTLLDNRSLLGNGGSFPFSIPERLSIVPLPAPRNSFTISESLRTCVRKNKLNRPPQTCPAKPKWQIVSEKWKNFLKSWHPLKNARMTKMSDNVAQCHASGTMPTEKWYIMADNVTLSRFSPPGHARFPMGGHLGRNALLQPLSNATALAPDPGPFHSWVR